MEKSKLPFSIIAIIILTSGYFLSNTEKATKMIPVITKKQALKLLKVQVLDTSTQWDGKVDVAYTNLSDDYVFTLTETGLKYKTGGETEYLKRKTPVTLKPNETVSLTISIPFLIKPRVAYAFEDDVTFASK